MFGNRRHFRELLTRSEERIASNILADRLTRLEKAGLVSRRDDPSHKQKVIYSLTEVLSAATIISDSRTHWNSVARCNCSQWGSGVFAPSMYRHSLMGV